MKTRRKPAASSQKLRAQAEKLLIAKRRDVAQIPVADVQKLVHELQVHQIELEMQNDQLRLTQRELEQARDRYADLYDFSPTAHLTLNAPGEILEANLNAGELLGLDRNRLIHQNFTRFVAAAAQAPFHSFCREVFSSDVRRCLDLELVHTQGGRFFAHVEARRDATGPRMQCRLTFNDISERKHMEQSLRESQRFAQCVVDSLAASIAIIDAKGRIVAVNEHWRDFAGRNGTSPALVSEGADYLAVCAAGAGEDADIATITAGLHEVLAGRSRQFQHEYSCHSPTEQRWFSMRATPFAGDGQRRAVVAHEDITERKRAERELRRSEERYRTLIEQSPEGVFVTDAQAERFNFVDVNSAACQMLGCTREEALGLSLRDVVVPEDQSRLGAEVAKLMTGETVLSEWRVRRQDGSVFPAEVRARQIPDGRFQAVARDLTERKQAEAALRNASQFNQQIIAGAKEGIIVYDRDLKYQVWNPFMEELTGIRAADVVGQYPLDVFPFLQAAGIIEALERVLAGEECATKEFRFQVPQNGCVGWVSDTNSPLRNAKGEITGVIGIVSDITERKRAEERIAQLNRVQAILAGVDRAIIRIPERQKLLEEVCRVAVEQGGFTLAWVGMVTPAGGVQPVAQAGATGYLKGIRVVTRDVAEGRGPVATAIRENRPVVIEDIRREVRMAPWHTRARRYGLNYVAAFPIRIASAVVGSFQVYAPQADLFDETEMGLLTMVSDELSFALTAIAELDARKQAEEALRLSEHNLKNFFDQAPIGLVWLSASGIILRANLAQLDLMGYEAADYLGQSFIKFCGEPSQGVELLRRLATKQQVHDFPMTRRRKDGVIRHVLVDAVAFWSQNQFQYSSIFLRDITDRIELEKEILQVGERERRRMAQDLHDGLGQLLVGAAYLAGILRQDLAAQSRAEARRLARVLEVIHEAIAQTRNLARGLHPVEAEPNGLMVALATLAARTKKMFHVDCRFRCRRPVLIQDNVVATHLFRIAQEAVTNAIKHGKPGRIEIGLAETPGRISLAIKDNGVGMPAQRRKKPGMGLRIMSYRAGIIGGSLVVQKEACGGTTIVCTVHLAGQPGLNHRPPAALKQMK